VRSSGERWETRALRELEGAGLRLIERNWHCRLGEIDLIMRDGEALVFVEVRYRDAADSGSALDSIGAAKRTKLVRAAQLYLAQRPASAQRPCRFDVVAFDGNDGEVRCEWLRNAFDAF
jgi:putative endonuclease